MSTDGILSRFRIEGLYEQRNIDLPLQDNILILIGENGTGKSTVATFVFLFLTRQWRRLVEHSFHRIIAIIDGVEISITKTDLENYVKRQDTSRRYHMSQSMMRDIDRELDRRSLLGAKKFNNDIIREIAQELGIPVSIVREYILWPGEQIDSDEIEKKTQLLATSSMAQVLYLPTFRRIEQDLQAIFRGLEPESPEARMLRDLVRRRTRGDKYVELVEFGMEDVEKAIQVKMEEIKDGVRNGLNNLTGRYFRDVIRGDYQTASISANIEELDDKFIDEIFRRIPRAFLSHDEQRRLRQIVAKMREEKLVNVEDRVVAHFLTQLIELHKTRQDEEKDVREFVRVSNEYLTGKSIVYDNQEYTISIQQPSSDGSMERLSMRLLSSGEKQIISLFSQIYLSSGKQYFVIIDEPELSLSVPWQRSFLPDIVNSGHCKGLIAVTHSPFVYDNELERHVCSLEEYVERINVFS